MATLGELERAVMDLLWEHPEAITANTLRDLLSLRPASTTRSPDTRSLAVTTVLTVLSRLEKKGLVERERSTRPHRYRAVTSRAEPRTSSMSSAVWSAPDREAVLARFIGTVSDGEAETLRKLLGRD